jgi:hypothetical protein
MSSPLSHINVKDSRRGEGMRCPYFQEQPVIRCCAFLKGLKLPTAAEREKCCLNGIKYFECPTYVRKEKDLQKIA